MSEGTIETSKRDSHKLFYDNSLAERRAALLAPLAHPVRLRLVAALCSGEERTVTELGELLEIPQPTVSRHLTSLRLHGLVRVRSDGGFRWYSLALPQLVELIDCLAACRTEGP